MSKFVEEQRFKVDIYLREAEDRVAHVSDSSQYWILAILVSPKTSRSLSL